MKTPIITLSCALLLSGCAKEEYRYTLHVTDEGKNLYVFDRKTGTIYRPKLGSSITIDGLHTRADGETVQLGLKNTP